MAEMMTAARLRQWIVAASVGVLLLSLAECAASAGGKVAPNAELSELLGVGLVVAQLVFHVLLHHLEHYVGHSHPSLLPILRTVYRELLILGFVSFTFILAATFGKFGDELFVSFEFAHLLIFLLAVFYIIVVLVTTWTSLSLSARWQEIESMEFVTYLANKQEFTELKTERERHRNYLWRWVLWWKGNPLKLERFHYLHERMAFHDSRFQFLYYRALPEDFSFSAYLRKVKTQVFRNLVEVHWTIWVALLVFILADYVRRQIWDSQTFDQGLIIGLSITAMLAADALGIKISRVYWRLFKRPATYFNDVTQALTTGLPLDDDAPPSKGSRAAPGDYTEPDSHLGRVLPDGHVLRPSPSELARVASRSASQEVGGDVDPDDTDFGMRSTVRRSLGGDGSARASSASISDLRKRRTDPLEGEDGFEINPDGGDNPNGPPSSSKGKAEFIDSIFSAEAEPRRSLDGANGRKDGARHPADHGDDEAVARHSIELRRSIDGLGGALEGGGRRSSVDGGRRRSSTEGHRQSSTEGRRRSSTEGGRRTSIDRNGSEDEGMTDAPRRMSLEVAGNLPVGELEERHLAARGLETGGRRGSNADRDNAGRRRRSSLDRRASAGGRRRAPDEHIDHEDSADENDVAHINTSIIDRHKKALEAQEQGPRRDYPKLVTTLFPRLARRASPAEKLFWAGSHVLFLWLEEFVLFGSTLVTSVVVAGYATAAFKGVQKGASAKDIAAITMVLVAQAYVLLRVAQSLKLYIFVLNSSGLLDEERALAAIDRVKSGKRRLRFHDYNYGSAADEDDLYYGDDDYGEEGRQSLDERRAADREQRKQLYKHLSQDAETLLEDHESDSEGEVRMAAVQPGSGSPGGSRVRRTRSGAPASPGAMV
eukprot:TRINITY_DN927_c0_g1_i1.p1 TRINITY_DN927_c0_g1~~TRINITY_DN927_c0_g1_i1.p1  ORF type:complete len:883 (+),score=356.96 TRINITY_DN927_c0_g1_i1:276-2924(+)